MKKVFRVFLAAVHLATALTILISQAETASDDFERAKSSTAAHLSFQADLHTASDPHFSHAKKTGRDFDLSHVPVLRFNLTEEKPVLFDFNSGSVVTETPRPPRSPPLR